MHVPRQLNEQYALHLFARCCVNTKVTSATECIREPPSFINLSSTGHLRDDLVVVENLLAGAESMQLVSALRTSVQETVPPIILACLPSTTENIYISFFSILLIRLALIIAASS
jgi:hypothetical protein